MYAKDECNSIAKLRGIFSLHSHMLYQKPTKSISIRPFRSFRIYMYVASSSRSEKFLNKTENKTSAWGSHFLLMSNLGTIFLLRDPTYYFNTYCLSKCKTDCITVFTPIKEWARLSMFRVPMLWWSYQRQKWSSFNLIFEARISF